MLEAVAWAGANS